MEKQKGKKLGLDERFKAYSKILESVQAIADELD
jgi:hypothetical protein